MVNLYKNILRDFLGILNVLHVMQRDIVHQYTVLIVNILEILRLIFHGRKVAIFLTKANL